MMNRIMARYNARLRGRIRSMGLTTAKMRALAVLSVIDAPLVGELAVYSIIEKSTLSRALDALEADGLIVRSMDREDSRAIRISITPDGRRAFEEVWPDMLDSYEAMFAGIGDDERQAFLGTLKKMLKNTRVHDY
ncbi:MarR family transcriptional regulator [Thalassococcus sp. S3]|nr:MarR family transcriptional regulator [Thalassococcus sp. S3]